MKYFYKLFLLLILCVSVNIVQAQQKTARDYFALRITAQKHLTGDGLEKNEKLAFNLIKECAKNSKDPKDIYILGKFYLDGTGTSKSNAKAIKWFDLSADAGSVQAMTKLGDNVTQDFSKAYEYFKRAAEKDFVPATYGAGYLTYKGHGIDQNYSEAIKWFEKGAIKDDASCIYMLGEALMNGNGLKITHLSPY